MLRPRQRRVLGEVEAPAMGRGQRAQPGDQIKKTNLAEEFKSWFHLNRGARPPVMAASRRTVLSLAGDRMRGELFLFVLLLP